MKHDYKTRVAWLTLQQEIIEIQDEWEALDIGLFIHRRNDPCIKMTYGNNANTMQIIVAGTAATQTFLVKDSTGDLGLFRTEEDLQALIKKWAQLQRAAVGASKLPPESKYQPSAA
jgi:hypothetical protein